MLMRMKAPVTPQLETTAGGSGACGAGRAVTTEVSSDGVTEGVCIA